LLLESKKYLIDAKVVNVNNVNELGLNALILHIMCGSKGKYKNTSIYKKIIIYLIKGGININHQDNDGNTALHIAIKLRQNNEIIKLLLDNGADVNIKNKNGKTPLDIAMEKGDKDIINLLKMYAKK
jgi:ankyrin repeat protein